MPAQATTSSPRAMIDAAKATVQAYNDKNWEKARSLLTGDCVYDEVATGRRVKGPDNILPLWKGWAQAFPDSKGTVRDGYASDTTVVLELTWKGSHQGPLDTPGGPLAATGRKIEIRACMILEMANEKVRAERHYFDMATLFDQLGLNA